ncbi:rRNA maturation RNase YbeY [Aminipila butyrica]|uniref:Endoribonuclease YbeY n=1 Tax=Aminipila butyrica TaxID=433296 RepID=A0A858BV33_9FIRM|nr:rRNA maturation RNase YbeY [Aminipila butyrica]QIB69252.1 rRNA maturation RNase YbeY [Aminipila butyrica]
MNIIFSEERMPGQAVVEKMTEAGKLCIIEEGLDPKDIVVSVTFVDEEEIHQLNKQYREVDRVTDVLSFPQFDDLTNLPKGGEVCIGDVVICPEQALLQADDFGHSPERELVYLFVHSVFHLLGYDHLEEEDKVAMREKEERIMNQIGIER